VPGARTREEFVDGLRRGCTIPMGRSGSYARLTSDVARIFGLSCLDRARRATDGVASAAHFAAMLAMLPLVPLLPIVTAAVWARELFFGARCFRDFQGGLPRRLRPGIPSGPFGPAPAPTPASP
jgi:hypothetical protein